MPVDLDELECILSNRTSPRLHHYGVEVDCQQYHSDELAELRLRLGHEASVDIRFRDELGHIWVRDPYRNLFFQVPNRDKRMVGKSRDLYKQARQRVKQEKGDPNDNDAVLVAYHQIMVDAEEAKRSNKLRKRRAAAQVRLDKEGRERQPSLPATEPKPTQASLAFEFDGSAPTFDIHPRSF